MTNYEEFFSSPERAARYMSENYGCLDCVAEQRTCPSFEPEEERCFRLCLEWMNSEVSYEEEF